MFVYLMRHGLTDGGDDFHRALSEDGVRQMKVQAAAFRKAVGVLHEVWTSPFVRTRQTADLVAAAQHPELPVRVVKELAHPEDVDAILGQLRRADGDRSVLLVGHQPGMIELASKLLVGRRKPMLNFTCGAACCLEIVSWDPDVKAQLHWLLTARQWQALA